ncbi:ABC transporter ATP-binding protein [Paenibacillus gallinarum]|uniref:ABC transporter ATP-binding protein n=1 Tax=Paenibacillus gallinarum TaxID=2762232 RepID=A0ABR8T3Y3_9BACL|nr:ABC transporter ATP-binding protein [Paenibacillus gallinarum]MBD7969989.1 ABC transporter ATP-binding protein [Paenibacillus gallinarum]
MADVIELNGLTKSYGKTFHALQDLNLTIQENKIYGLLGRNGAGKTTLLHLISAQLFPTSGELKVFGEAPYENKEVLRQICFIKESQKYPDTFRVRDVLSLASSLYPNWNALLADSLVLQFNLPANRRVKKLSRGMLSSVGIIIGLASRAPLTIFDEPYLGLDAVARQLFYDQLIQDYMEYPRTIVLSTHLIDEISAMLEQVIVLHEGKLLLNEEAEQFRGSAFHISGKQSDVDHFITGKEVLHQEVLGSMCSAVVRTPNQKDFHKQAELNNLKLAPVSLQQLMVYLTKQTNREEVK